MPDTAPVIYVAYLTTVRDAAILAASMQGKLRVVAAAQAGLPAELPAGQRLTAIDPEDAAAVDALLAGVADDTALAVFPQLRPSVCGIGAVHGLALLLGERVGHTYVPVFVDADTGTVTKAAPRKLTPPVGETAAGLAQWRMTASRKLLEEARLAVADLDETVPQLVLRSVLTHGAALPVFRQVLPEPRTITNRLLLRAAFALGSELAGRHAFGERVGLMLPTSAGTAAAFFACHFAGVVPVMLNFGAGNANLVSACATAQVRTVYTSAALLQKLDVAKHGAKALVEAGCELVMLERLRDSLSLRAKLGAVAGLLAPAWRFSQLPGSSLTPDSEAVVLFTSGSEGAPKGVVLSHRNVVANAAQILSRLEVGRDDLLFNCLPVFHSFGMMAGLMLPVAAGVPSLQVPSPLLYNEIPAMIRKERATFFFSTNTFLAQYAKHGKQGDFASLRLIVAGGEKLKASVRDTWQQRHGHEVLEGYGVTETAPGIAISIPQANRPGSIGLLLPGIAHRLEPVAGIATGGSLVVSGPNVMKGYLFASEPGKLVPPPDGWYDTGDIVDVDAQGYVWVVGRKKRFAKVAGEMVPLARLEEVFASLLGEGEHGVVVALADERRGESLVMVTTSTALTRAALVGALRAAGLPELWVPRRIEVIGEMPLLATGKTDYPAVAALLDAAADS